VFEAAEVGNKTDKATYKREVPRIREELLELQRAVAGSNLAPVIHIGGVEGPGKGEVVDLLLEWMDARGIEAHALFETTDEETQRPRYWRFWRVLPPRGTMSVLLGSWYTDPIIDRAFDRIDDVVFEREMRRIRDFERMLTLEGIPLIKFWLHLAKGAQRKLLKKLKKDPNRRWLVSDTAWEFFEKYDDFRQVSEAAIRLTSTGAAPWHVVEATDVRHRNLTVTTTLARAIREALEEEGAREAKRKSARKPALPRPTAANPGLVGALGSISCPPWKPRTVLEMPAPPSLASSARAASTSLKMGSLSPRTRRTSVAVQAVLARSRGRSGGR